jgi:hypothetical protein
MTNEPTRRTSACQSWHWIYTYREDGAKFWGLAAVGAVSTVVTLLLPPLIIIQFLAGLGAYIYGIVTAATRPSEWYLDYNSNGDAVAMREAAR